MDKADNGAKFRAVVVVPGAFVNSPEATATVTDDKARPVLVGARGGPNRPEVTLTFSERLNQASATAIANYRIAAAGGAALGVTEAALSADRTQVTLKTAAQTVGTQYTVTVNNVADLAAATPNTVAANSQASFYGLGPLLQGIDGFVVWEAEDFDRNLDGLWVADTERGVASAGVSMVNRNGAGGDEANTKLEYDIYFPKAGTNIIWWRFSGNDGNDDSAYVHVDGARPVGRDTGNLAVLSGTGSSLAGNWGWTANPFEGGGQMTFVIDTPGVHSIAIARREDGSYVDKFVITKDPNFNPTTSFGTFGPSPTLRQGEPAPTGATIQITTQPASTNGLENTSITLRGGAAIPQGFLFTYQWQRKQGNTFADIGGATLTNFTINPLTIDWNGATVRLRVTVAGDVKYSDEAAITVTPETTAPEIIKATGSALKSQVLVFFAEPVTSVSAQNTANYNIASSTGVSVAVQSATLMPNGRAVVLSTGAQTVGTKYTVTVNGVADTAAKPNLTANAQTKFYSLGALQPQGDDGLLVFEAEDFDRNQGDLWVVDNVRGTPSASASIRVPTGADNDAMRVEYDLTFTKTGTHVIWFRGTGNSGSDDSAWLLVDGARPSNRATGTLASMTGFPTGTSADFGWASGVQGGTPPMTFPITAGAHSIGLGLREDGAYFDKFAISSDTNFVPTAYGTFGPPETRAGSPALPTLDITSPTANAQFNAGVDIPITVAISATTRTISKVEFFRGAAKVGESTATPFNFNWQNAPTGTNNITARLTDDVNDSVSSRAVSVIVSAPQGITLTATVGPGGLNLAWKGGTAPYIVQKKTALSDPAWVDVLTTNDAFATVPIQGNTGFFRVTSQ